MLTTVPIVAPAPGHAPEETREHVAEALPDQLPVRVVALPGQRVGDQGGQQRVDRTEQSDGQGGLEVCENPGGGQRGQTRIRKARGHVADDRYAVQPEDAEERSGYQRGYCGGQEPPEPARPDQADSQGHGGHR